MRIVAVSDTHEQAHWLKYPPGDLLIHAGDITNNGAHYKLIEFDNFMGTLRYNNIVAIGGNHERSLEKDPEFSKICFTNSTYLKDSGTEIQSIKIWGSPWTPRFFDWAFNLDRGRTIKEKWDLIPDDTEILITHGPPFGILDLTDGGRYSKFGSVKPEKVGCEELRKTVFERLKNLKLHIFGHIHYSYGTRTENGVLFVNAASCTENYNPTNKPIVIDFVKGQEAVVLTHDCMGDEWPAKQ